MQYRHYYIICSTRTKLASNGSIKLTIITNHLTQINFNTKFDVKLPTRYYMIFRGGLVGCLVSFILIQRDFILPPFTIMLLKMRLILNPGI